MLKYHFSIHIHFKKDVDLNIIEKEIGLTASKKTFFKLGSLKFIFAVSLIR